MVLILVNLDTFLAPINTISKKPAHTATYSNILVKLYMCVHRKVMYTQFTGLCPDYYLGG